MDDTRFPRLVSLACHDLRTPLATVYGFARTLSRAGELDERSARFVEMIEAAAEQMTELLDELGVAARIEGGRWEAPLVEADTLELATAHDDDRIETAGEGAAVETEPVVVARSLRALAIAAVRHGGLDVVTWTVSGRELALSSVTAEAAPIVLGEEIRDLGALVAHATLGALGATVELDGETLRVTLPAQAPSGQAPSGQVPSADAT